MTKFVTYKPYNMATTSLLSGQVVAATSSELLLVNGEKAAYFYGHGVNYLANGAITSGTVVGYAEYWDGELVGAVTGGEMPAVNVARYIVTNDAWGVYNELLSGDDELYGSNFDDALYGFAGDDFFWGGGGRNLLDGGAGLDVVSYDGARADYDVSNDAGLWVVSKHGGGRVDALSNMERLSFADGDVYIDNDSAQVYRLYQAAFARTPDAEGLRHNIALVDQGMSLEQMSNAFVASAEFAQLYGEQIGDKTFIETLYNNILGREGEAQGVNGWLALLVSGEQTRAQVLQGFSESPENINLVATQIEGGIFLEG